MPAQLLHSEDVSSADRVTDRERLLQHLATNAAPRGFAIAYDLLGQRSAAEDAVQEALARACESHARLRDPDAVDGWFFRILTNICLRVLRRRRLGRTIRELLPGGRDEPNPAMAADVAIFTGEAELATDEVVARRAEAAMMLAALDRLPAKQRTALVLRYGHDLAVADVADMLGIGTSTAKTHLVRGLRRLREVMRRES